MIGAASAVANPAWQRKTNRDKTPFGIVADGDGARSSRNQGTEGTTSLRATEAVREPGSHLLGDDARSEVSRDALPVPARLTGRLFAGCRRSCPLGLLGMLATIGIVEQCVAPRMQDASRVGRVEMSWEEAARAAGGSEGQSEILLLGDSRIKLGLLPRVLHEQLGLSVYNLGTLGGQAPGSYFLLRRVLERGSRPRAIVVDYSESLLKCAPGQNAACWADRFGWRDGVEVAWHSADPALGVSAALHGLLPGWCDGRDRSLVFGFAAKTPHRLAAADDDRRVFERNWRQNRGAQVAPRAFVPVEEMQAEAAGDWRPDPANVYYVDRLLRMAQAHSIAVYWFLPPSIPERRERLPRNGVSVSYRKFVAERLAKFSNLIVLDGEQLAWGLDSFRDPLHVNRDGAVRLSRAVAAATQRRLRGEEKSGLRWIELIETDGREAGTYQNLVEDLDQSRAAIHPIVVGQSSGEVIAW